MAVSGFSEEFFAERFRRPGNLDVLEQQLRDYDLQKTEQTFDKEFVLKNLHFSAKLPEKAVTLLKPLIPSILEFSANQTQTQIHELVESGSDDSDREASGLGSQKIRGWEGRGV